THMVTNEASSIPAEKSSLVSPASTPTAYVGNTPLVSPRPSAGRSSKSTGKKLASSSKTPIPAGRFVSAGKPIPADRSVSADKSIPAGRSVSAGKSIPADRSVSADKSIPAGRSVSAGKSIPADRSVSADKSIPADRSISASRDTNSADKHPSKLSSNAEVVPADKGVSAASINKGKGIAVESSVPQRKQTPQEIEQESKSDSEYAKQVAQTMETSYAEPAPQVRATGPLPFIKRQRDLDDIIASFSNTEWMILKARVKDFPEVAKEILGADVNDDNFSSR
nr:hypothetical protein [Tanacetum cinerariifolium]